ncbi:MAG TPA: hypothetical protein VFC07_00525 [Verrucomicrobiae bacterium]|nr:hypothetical protein [Verrucomicrobiae bacterium]
MKRILPAMLVLMAGTTLFYTLRHSTNALRQEAAEARETLTRQIQLMVQARIQLTNVQEQVRELKGNLRDLKKIGGPQAVDPLLSRTGSTHLSAAQSEQMLTELGFNWKSTGDYLVVSKDTLRAVSLDGIRGMKMNEAAAGVLALTPDERANVDALIQSLGRSYQNWVETHAQRVEPGGKVIAQYTLPADADFSQSLSSQFTEGVLSALGEERGNLLLQYSGSWMQDLGMNEDNATTLTVTRYGSGDNMRLGFTLKSSDGSNMSTDVSPYQPFPQAFLPLFPNGWKDLANREGFSLPKSFQKE